MATSTCQTTVYQQATSSAKSRGITNTNSMQVLIGGKFDLGAKVSVQAGKKFSYSYTDTTVDESGQSIQESLSMCSTTPHFHQCLRMYFDKAIGTYIFDKDSEPSTNPNDGMNCGL